MPFRFGTRRSLGLPVGGGGAILKPQDVSRAVIYTGPGAAQQVNSGFANPDFVWSKTRSQDANHAIVDLLRPGKGLATNTTAAEYNTSTALNGSGASIFEFDGAQGVAWFLKRAAKFFDTNTFTHTNGTPTNIDLSSLGVVGDAVVKRRDAAGDWYAWHRSLMASNNLRLNTTAAQSTTDAFISVSGTTLTFSASAPSGNYTYQARAHDPSADGIVQCGSFTTNGSGAATIPTGWPIQYLLIKSTSEAGNWYIVDTARGFGAGDDKYLMTQSSGAEAAFDFGAPTATGANITIPFSPSASYIYLAIRAPY